MVEKKRQILLVDDDPDLTDALQTILEAHGYGVRTAGDSREAMSALETGIPDVIILDIMMTTPTEGFDFACELRKKPEFQNVPIVLLTGFLGKVREEGPDRFEHILGREWPAKWLFEKPVDTKRLLAKIEGILAGG